MRVGPLAWPVTLACAVACSPARDAAVHSPGEMSSGAPPPSASGGVSAAEPASAPPIATPVAAPGKLMSQAQARAYMVELINRDRASMGLPAVRLDEAAATHAGQAHAEDMATHGYLGHWGTDGSVPEQRFTDAGGVDMILENASCFTDERARKLDRAARIDPKNIEQAEDMFFHEKPPHDGHRKNILKAWHKSVGIGIAQPVATPTEIPVPCIAQEFADPYGTYLPLPRKLRADDVLHVGGTITAPATFAGVGLARTDAPKPIAVSELNKRRSYPVPAPYQMYWPPGFETPIPVKVTGARFSIDLPASDSGKAGLYELSVWARVPGWPDFVMVSLRTFEVH